MKVQNFFDKDTNTFTYILIDEDTNKCAILDSVLDYNQSSGEVTTDSADKIIDYIKDNKLELEWILESHIHADHLTASKYLKDKLGGKTAISSGIIEVLKTWIPIFNAASSIKADGSQFDKLFNDGDIFKIGNSKIEVVHTIGHTPACASYKFNDGIFVGDTIFAPNLGSARADFPGGDAKELYKSIKKILSLPDSTKIYLCHDYPKEGIEPKFSTTVGEENAENIMINNKVTEAEFIQKREARDKQLQTPKLLYPAIQVNLRAGDIPEPEANGVSYIKIPIRFK